MIEVECVVSDIYLQPGEAYLARQPAMIRTLLGSCVGITFWCARLGAGALCHALLPRCPRRTFSSTPPAQGYRYVDFAVSELAREFDRLGALRAEVQVKVFGGADVLPVSAAASLRPTVGRQNCEAAIAAIRDAGFHVMASSVGGNAGRVIQFHTGTGEVRLRWLSRLVFEAAARRHLPALPDASQNDPK